MQHQNAAGLTVSAEYDWRFLTPVRLTDINDNTHCILTDALGQVRAGWFSGTENGVAVGFSGPAGFSLPGCADEAITLTADRRLRQPIFAGRCPERRSTTTRTSLSVRTSRIS
ncbi:TPA: hypothetical protein QH070_005053 [Klebsiella aerogenes]|nr:hypothetical protein [Klebsiella aerogenes]HDT1383948.1 hypothetical protein [Klebsiella aerogenes]HDU5193210.1 hypothetical protein [Klebsiella aerogenes]HDU5290754.1 hypothetical protein [Klebsiella aerogenes]